jgi:plastocyanin
MSAPPLAVESHEIPFLIAAGVFAVFAVIVGIIGIRSDKFSSSGAGPLVVMGLAVLFAAGVMTAAVATAQRPSKEDVEPLKTVPEQAAEPSSNAPAAPGTASAPAPAGPPGKTVKLAADPSGQLKYDTDKLTAKAGAVTINFTNAAPTPHDVTVRKGSKQLGKTPEINSSKARVTIKLAKGEYEYFCSVPGHEQAGMKGTLTVQ